MEIKIQIENLKCGGCAATIKKGLLEINDVDNVIIDVEKSTVVITSSKEVSNEIELKLSKLGYPKVGDKNTVLHKAKSFVSCAVGRLER